MSDEIKSDTQPEIKPPKHAREHLWHAAFWAGMNSKQQLVDALRDGYRPWYSELAPLTVEERILVMGALCKQLFSDMTEENQGQVYAHLVSLYGPLKSKRKKGASYAH